MNTRMGIALVLPFLLDACGTASLGASAASNSMKRTLVDSPVITICQIKEKEENYLNSEVRVKGDYIFNGMNYSFLSDVCGEGSARLIFDLLYAKSEEESIVKSKALVANSCNKITGYCSQRFFLDMDAVVELNKDGTLVLVPTHIFSISPIEDGSAN